MYQPSRPVAPQAREIAGPVPPGQLSKPMKVKCRPPGSPGSSMKASQRPYDPDFLHREHHRQSVLRGRTGRRRLAGSDPSIRRSVDPSIKSVVSQSLRRPPEPRLRGRLNRRLPGSSPASDSGFVGFDLLAPSFNSSRYSLGAIESKPALKRICTLYDAWCDKIAERQLECRSETIPRQANMPRGPDRRSTTHSKHTEPRRPLDYVVWEFGHA